MRQSGWKREKSRLARVYGVCGPARRSGECIEKETADQRAAVKITEIRFRRRLGNRLLSPTPTDDYIKCFVFDISSVESIFTFYFVPLGDSCVSVVKFIQLGKRSKINTTKYL